MKSVLINFFEKMAIFDATNSQFCVWKIEEIRKTYKIQSQETLKNVQSPFYDSQNLHKINFTHIQTC